MERRLTAILALDVVGYSRLTASDEAGTHSRLQTLLDSVIGPVIAERNGHVIKFIGDGALVEFPSIVDAVKSAIAIQEDNSEAQAVHPPERRMLLRAGVNLGDVIVDDGDIFGDGVIKASRLEALAEPGGICVTRTVLDHAGGKLDARFEPMGFRRLKNVPDRVEIFRVVPAGDVPRRPRPVGMPWRLLAAAASLATVGLGLWLFTWSQAKRSEGIAERSPSLAVLPFTSPGATGGDTYFADGMTDDLITDLSKLSELRVIASHTMFTYKDRDEGVCDIARGLGVSHVLEGSVRRGGDRTRVNVKLIQCPQGDHLWAERYDRGAKDFLSVQDEVIGSIVENLSVRLSPAEQQRLERLPTTNLEAYDNYLRGEGMARQGDRRTYGDALRFFRRAVALDPRFAQAFAAMARAEATVMRMNYDDVLNYPVARKRAYSHAGRALELDPDLAAPWAILSGLQLVDRRYGEALSSAERAVALAPNDSSTHAALALVHLYSGRSAEAVQALEDARRLDPNLPVDVLQEAGFAYMLNGNPDKAVAALEEARDAATQADETLSRLAAAYHLAGRSEAARETASALTDLWPILSVELLRIKLAHFRNPADLDLLMTAMLDAGVQRWPFSYRPGDRMPLTGVEIADILYGRTWKGRDDGAGPLLIQFDDKGRLGMRSSSTIATGEAYVVGDLLCERIEALTLGRPTCGPVHHADPQLGGGYDYIYASATKVFRFSPVE